MNNWQRAKYKSKEHAISRAVEMIVGNPACAGLDGMVTICYGGEVICLPVAKKPKKNNDD